MCPGLAPVLVCSTSWFPISCSPRCGFLFWFPIPREPGRADLVFDSFGRVPGPGWMPHLLGAAVTDTDPNQRLSDDNCGQISLGWGHVFIQHGYDVAQQC